jgi:hypothetical protein
LIVSGNVGEFEDSELPVLIYNLALCAFYQRNFTVAQQLLEQVGLRLG